jgi:hypothetical protein
MIAGLVLAKRVTSQKRTNGPIKSWTNTAASPIVVAGDMLFIPAPDAVPTLRESQVIGVELSVRLNARLAA